MASRTCVASSKRSRVAPSLRHPEELGADDIRALRLLECAFLRVKDVDLDRREITVRDGKGRKDRVTPLPRVLVPDLGAHMLSIRVLHAADLARGAGFV